MIPEPYRSRLIAAGKDKNYAEIDAVTDEARKAHPECYRPTLCGECAKTCRPEHDDGPCQKFEQYRVKGRAA